MVCFQNELFENAKVPTVDSSNQLPSVSAVATSRSDESGSGSQKSLMEQIYSENKRNIRYSHVHASGSNSLSLSSVRKHYLLLSCNSSNDDSLVCRILLCIINRLKHHLIGSIYKGTIIEQN